MPLPRSQMMRGRGGGRPSIKDRIGAIVVSPTGIGARGRNSLSVHSRLGIRGGGGIRGRAIGVGTVVGTRIQAQPMTDARQKINLNRVISGRISDARERIETKRVTKRVLSSSSGMGIGMGMGGFPSSRNSFPPMKSLKITTSNSPPRNGSGLFRSAVSGMGSSDWGYSPPPLQSRSFHHHSPPPSAMLTRTISNPQARGGYPPPPPPPFDPYGRPSGGSFYSAGGSMAKVVSNYNSDSRRDVGGNGGRFRSDYRDDAMDTDSHSPQSVRSALHARLDVPKFKIKVTNLQHSVSVEDLSVCHCLLANYIIYYITSTNWNLPLLKHEFFCRNSLLTLGI
jgi:hypothetical protein